MQNLSLIGRNAELFIEDINRHEIDLRDVIQRSKFLIVGGAGTIGQAVVREIFKRNPKLLHVVDINENNMVELVRDIRSTMGYGSGDFRTFSIDCGSREFEVLVNKMGPYDYVLNLSALKHVRSEKDPYTLMRLIDVNIFNTIKVSKLSTSEKLQKYFCVSTDKAANPVNMMGASKRIMELFLMKESLNHNISMARFANVAFSDGSLLHGFNMRFSKRQPISAPNDVKRYFVTQQESGELCLLSCLLGENRDIFFPKLSDKLNLISFSDIAISYLDQLGYEAFPCDTEEEARRLSSDLIAKKKWPCYFFKSDTTGEKDFEEFFTEKEKLNMSKFVSVGIIHNDAIYDENLLEYFVDTVINMRRKNEWDKSEIIKLFFHMLPDFAHLETGKYLDEKM